MFQAPFLNNSATDADCLYTSFHTSVIDDAAKRGIVWILRSLKPSALTH